MLLPADELGSGFEVDAVFVVCLVDSAELRADVVDCEKACIALVDSVEICVDLMESVELCVGCPVLVFVPVSDCTWASSSEEGDSIK